MHFKITFFDNIQLSTTTFISMNTVFHLKSCNFLQSNEIIVRNSRTTVGQFQNQVVRCGPDYTRTVFNFLKLASFSRRYMITDGGVKIGRSPWIEIFPSLLLSSFFLDSSSYLSVWTLKSGMFVPRFQEKNQISKNVGRCQKVHPA